ncbi:MAG TPA: SPOR domain-containing protein [Candidatus Krumholzibacteriaceae bacterium]|nr:SPOR domain-containing protein [Candidatus Krumholzibacteriaceae bacterium]
MENSDSRDDSLRDNAGYQRDVYSISLSKEEMIKFIEEGDYSSTNYLDLYEEIGRKLEDKIREKGCVSFFLFSLGEDRVTRDFSVLQLAHFFSRKGKRLLIVDCDFLSPGLSGLIDNVEENGFLDLLLYGSSLKSVASPIGIEGVKTIGPGSFPVSRTVPFATKEFDRVNHFLRERNDVILYCSTLYSDSNEINPLIKFVDDAVISCRAEEFPKGKLRKVLTDLETSGFPSVKTIFFGGAFSGQDETEKETQRREEDVKKEDIKKKKKPETKETKGETADEEIGDKIAAGGDSGDIESGFIEKTEEIEPEDEFPGKRINPLRIVLVTAAFFVVAFLAWWFMRGSSIKEKSSSERINKAVQTIQEASRDSKKDVGQNTGEKEKTDTEKEKDEITKAGVADSLQEASEKETSGVSPDETEDNKEGDKIEEDVKPPADYYSVHIASFRDIKNAGDEAEYFEKKGFDVFVKQVTVKDTKWFRVLVGRHETKELANKTKMKLLPLKRIAYARVVEVDK